MTEQVEEILHYFIENLNWTFILICCFVLLGIETKEEFEFFRLRVNKLYRTWVACGIIILLFSTFKTLEEGTFDVSYLSELLRSLVVVIIFSGEIIKKIVK